MYIDISLLQAIIPDISELFFGSNIQRRDKFANIIFDFANKS